MNALAKIKLLSNKYDLVVESLYNEVTDEESGETTQEPITDVEGTTALLTTDGTSWEFVDEQWQQIDENIDKTILYSLFPFIMSVCNSIHNPFVKCHNSHVYKDVTLAYDEETKEKIDITNITDDIDIQADDYIIVKTCTNEYLTQVLEVGDETVKIDNRGLNIRVSGKAENIGLLFVDFPPQFLDNVFAMLAFDLFLRDDKEKRQERLGNYTYTNFEPHNYYGLGSYPTQLEDAVKYFQHIST